MALNKRQDAVLLKKLPGLLAFCEFALILVLIISSASSANANPNSNIETEASAPQESQEIETETTASVPVSVEKIHIAAISLKPKRTMHATVTAYSSTIDQTDDTPFHTANGKEVEDGIVAANFLPFGTRLRIPELFGDKIFTVQDRMHERFSDRHIDIWMVSREKAETFGIHYAKIEIF